MRFGRREVKKYTPEDTMTMEVISYLSLRHLTNTDDNTFLYKGHNDKFEERFVHEKAKKGARFTDGNNGDYWRVIVPRTEYKRLLVQNLSQDFVTILYWD